MALTTLANVKQWLEVTSNTNDALYTRLINAASEFIETWCNRTFAQAAYNEVRNGPGGVTLLLRNAPVTAVASLKIDGVVIPLSTAWNVDGYILMGNLLQLRGFKFARGAGNVEISYTAGYVTTPAEVEQVCIELVSGRMKNGRGDRIGVSSKSLAGESISFYRNDLTTDMKRMLVNYRRTAPL
jgi:hypothetical protein